MRIEILLNGAPDRLFLLVLVEQVDRCLLVPPKLNVRQLLAAADDLEQLREVFVAGRGGIVLHGLEGDVVARHQPGALQRPHFVAVQRDEVQLGQGLEAARDEFLQP